MAGLGENLRLEAGQHRAVEAAGNSLPVRAETPQEGESPYPWPKLPKLAIARK